MYHRGMEVTVTIALPVAEFRYGGSRLERPCPHDKEVVIMGAPIWEQTGTRGLVAKRGRARGLYI